MTTSTNDGALQVTFHCAACNGIAATVTYMSRGMTYPDPIVHDIGEQEDWFVIDGFLVVQGKMLGDRAAAVRDALERGSAKQLYQIDPLWAPFYCYECQATYCNKCWRIFPVMDDEYPGWYDYSQGYCPKWHERMVDD